LGKVKAIVNEANKAVREAARDLVVEILGALGIKPQEMDSYFGEESARAAIELRLTRFAGAILEQAKPKPPPKALPTSARGRRLDETPVERHEPIATDDDACIILPIFGDTGRSKRSRMNRDQSQQRDLSCSRKI
jgi:hypothetical protein